tara:strand:- start:810 stop:1223 length:414 start_codon:yes stop_codon:yes gene_type:complete
MAAGQYTFTVEQGSTTDFEVQYTDNDGNPIDLQHHVARMQLRQNKSSTTPYLTLSSSLNSDGTGLNLSGSKHLSGYPKPLASGSIGVYISAASSSELSFTEAVYDLEIASASSADIHVTRLLEGKIKLSKNVTLGSY